MFDSLKITTSYLSFYCFKVLFLNLKRNFRESYVFHCLVIKVLNLLSLRQLVYFTTSSSMCQVLFSSFFKLERRRRDLNPRAAINDLLPFQGSPFGQLGYFSKLPYAIASHFSEAFYIISRCLSFVKNFFSFIFILNSGESGIRTHAPLRTNGFQDRLVMTTSISLHMHFSVFDVSLPDARYILSSNLFTVNTNFYIF